METKLREIVAECAANLQQSDVDAALELVEHSEWGVALEMVCTQLFEYDASVNSVLLQKISDTGAEMGLRPELWMILKQDDRLA